jgi:UDP-N-acetylglucosamine:LPS N-acetylglucosamine transferase
MTTMLVAISGGHLAQLHMLAPRITAGDDVVWMTDDTAQSRSLLEGERVYHVPTRPPRDTLGVLRDTRVAKRAFAEHRIDRVVSSGAQIALSALIPALLRRVPFSYVESATRVTGLSTTGKLVDRIPTVHRYVQYPNRVSGRWGYALSVFDGFRVERAEETPITRAVVTVGGNGDFGFRRLVESAERALPDDATVLWQTGSTDASGLHIDAVAAVSSATLSAELAAADVVIGHAGTGTALAALSAGKVPVLSPRSVEHGEHIDSHQDDLAAFLSERGLAVVRQADEITYDDLREASRWRVSRRDDLAPVTI